MAGLIDPMEVMDQAIYALALDVPPSIHGDITRKWRAVKAELVTLRATQKGWDL